jgi:hypothetical protein
LAVSVLNHIAHSQGRRDEVPNQELARDLTARKDRAGIREIAENLWNKDKSIQADCIKVLYEAGALEPALIADYADDFIKLLRSRNNRLVWGGMTALAAVAELKADVIYTHRDEIQKTISAGSVITVDNGIQALARAAAKDENYNRAIFPYLLDHLKTCRPKDVAQHAEKTLTAVNATNKAAFISALETRMIDLSGSGLARVRKVLREAGKR